MERLIAVGALCAATQASACDISLTDLTAEFAQAVPEAQVVSSEGVSRFGNEPLFRYSLDFGAGEPVFVFEEFGCRTHNLRLVVLTPQTGLTPDDLGRISAVLQVAPLWQQQFADADLTGALTP